VFGNRTELTLGQLTTLDGTSNTLLFGECLGRDGVGGPPQTALSWWVGPQVTMYGLGRGNLPAAQGGADHRRFSSRHSAVVQFCFGDASLRGLRFGSTAHDSLLTLPSPGSDWWLLQQLAGKNDGRSADAAAILE
jgi:hypothetical protein